MALGCCDHSVCYRCFTKMQVLCEELLQVVFGKKLLAFATNRIQQLQHEKKHGLCRWKDGARDYYSDYTHLHEHFPEKRFLCEEQFTHAFSTEIDLNHTSLPVTAAAVPRHTRTTRLTCSSTFHHHTHVPVRGLSAMRTTRRWTAQYHPTKPHLCLEQQLQQERGSTHSRVPGCWWEQPDLQEDWEGEQGCTGRVACPPVEEQGSGLGAQELQRMPTRAAASLLGPASTLTSAKVGKKEKVGSEKPGTTLSLPLPSDHTPKSWAEKAPEVPVSRAEWAVAVIISGHTEGLTPAQSTPNEPLGLPRPLGSLPCPTTQEDIPVLGGPCPPRMPPPPGFNTVVLLKDTPPPTPLGLAPPVSKTLPNPGFYSLLSSSHPTCIPSPTNTTNTTTTTTTTTTITMKAPMLASTPRAYLVPENFWEKNLQLIQSIKDFEQSDKAHFSKFKIHLGEFR
ncbi:Zinc finger protein 598 [Sciurus carolinensis]|uniref:Zinc finger protein 598 n=1 Tax=Sciurus carolinensis TaxID=30640 RepID=A0AA41T1Z2_SCICA|nr:Zinc finger protein 598 [Sciurus carolinensis]